MSTQIETTTMTTSTSSTPSQLSPIQRILIFHLSLPEMCLNGKSLGENASLDEISEQIFFFYCSSSDKTDLEEAVQFLSLSIALYTLPTSLILAEGNDEQQKDDNTNNTKEIFFGNSTLVFVLLERDVLAVVQIPRLYQNGGHNCDSSPGGGNPHAVRSSMKRCHLLFSMFRGGGINCRLRKQCNGIKNKSNCPFPGMDELYSLKKNLRVIRQRISRWKLEGKDCLNLQKEADLICEKIETLSENLPIRSIRRDLDAHYKEYIGDILLVMSRQGCGIRCLVENIPIPIAQDSKGHLIQSSPSPIDSQSHLKLSQEIKRLLKDFTQGDDECSDPDFLGISTFHQGQLLYTHSTSGSNLSQSSFQKNSQDSETITSETICLIMGYMASFRAKMSQLSNHPSPVTSTRKALLGLSHFFTSGAAQTFDDKMNEISHTEKEGGTFLGPPPPFMLNIAHDTRYCELHDDRKIWSPRVKIPVIMKSDCRAEDAYIDTGVILYDVKGFNFLLYSKYYTSNDRLAKSLLILEDGLNEICTQLTEEDGHSISSSPSDYTVLNWNRPGVDLILVDRDQYKLILFSDRNQTAIEEKLKLDSRKASRGYLGFGSGAKQIPHQNERNNLHVEWATLGLDCRHLLASHLHLDVILAFDDMMNEISEMRKSAQFSETEMTTSTSPFFELCTCMTLGWVYAFVDDEMELYAFFDSSTYVTVADVQNEVNQIKEKHFREWANYGRRIDRLV